MMIMIKGKHEFVEKFWWCLVEKDAKYYFYLLKKFAQNQGRGHYPILFLLWGQDTVKSIGTAQMQ
jgi:hypothetical protein